MLIAPTKNPVSPPKATPDKITRPHEMGLKVCLRAGDTLENVRRMLELGCDYIPSNCMHGVL